MSDSRRGLPSKREPAQPPTPIERQDTIRHEIAALLRRMVLSARDISREVGIPERDVYDHLGHIARTLRREDSKLVIHEPECGSCGYVFRRRTHLTRPGKCPQCLSRLISDPLFSIRSASRPRTRPESEPEPEDEML